LPHKPFKAFAYAVLIWVVGFVWGSVVFMTPALKATTPIPYISSNPAISFPILLIWTVLALFLARTYLKTAPDPAREGLRLGIMFALVNFVLDLIVLVFFLKTGFKYFISASVWFAYATLILIPWITGRSLEKSANNPTS
jgi:hypothetical protein